MSACELVAAPTGELCVGERSGLRVAWGLAANERPWEGGVSLLPDLPAHVQGFSDIPRAQILASSDGRFDDGDNRNALLPQITVGADFFEWRPISWRKLRRRFIRFTEAGPSVRITWDSGTDAPSRFIGRCLGAAVQGYLEALVDPRCVAVAWLQPITHTRPFTVQAGGARRGAA